MLKTTRLHRLRQNKGGFTLIELLVVSAIVAITIVGIFVTYKSIERGVYVNNLSNQIIDSNHKVQATLANTLSSKDINTNLNMDAFFPSSMIHQNRVFTSMGNPIELRPHSTDRYYDFVIRDVSSDYCTAIATSKAFRSAAEIKVGNVIVKRKNEEFNNDSITSITANCSRSGRTDLIATFISSALHDLDTLYGVGSSDSGRSRASGADIAKIPSVESAVPCSGGRTWDKNFCSCPSNSAWNGTSCQPFNTTGPQPGWCKMGEGWEPNTKTCKKLPHGSSSGTYADGQYIPSTVEVSRLQTSQKSITDSNELPDADSKIIAGRQINWGKGQASTRTVYVCVNGSWDEGSKSCVTVQPK